MLTEDQRIARFVAAYGAAGSAVVAGPGDDCALTRPRPGRLLVSTVDEVVEGLHFTSAFRPVEIGHKALAVSLSDLAAAGADPRWILVALAMPRDFPGRDLEQLARGMGLLGRRCGVALAGGNLTVSSRLSVAVTALGEVRPREAVRREGARPGDLLLVTGTLGGAALGVQELSGGRPRRLSQAARRQLTPEPRVALGRVLGRYASAAVDVSDGLLRDLGHLCRRSGVGADVDLEALPLDPGLAALGDRGLRLALSGGEDYELCLALSPARLQAFRNAARRGGVPATVIGRFTRRRGIRLHRRGTRLTTSAHTGYDPFAPSKRP